jgi:2,4-dienoyl-CoA reductase-like NADH-dependent reductase (Old Yellow Enzyme family)
VPLIDQPFRLKNTLLQSRLVRSATVERLALKEDGEGTRLGEMYRKLGEGGVGLIITGSAAMNPAAKASPTMAELFDDRHLRPWQLAVGLAHQGGAKIHVQLNHAGGRTRAAFIGTEPQCVSRIERQGDAMLGRELDEDAIVELIACYAASARMAVDAGADGIQIHAAHGYLVSQFLSPLTNHRSDRWGGDLEGRCRFLREVVRTTREAIGTEACLGMKIGATDDDPRGLTLEETIEITRELQEIGLDTVEVSGGFRSDAAKQGINSPDDEAYYLPWARAYKEVLDIPVMAVGGFRSLAVIDQAVESGACDLVSMCRPLIRQPDVLKRLLAGEEATCTSCTGCLHRVRHGITRCVLDDSPPPA